LFVEKIKTHAGNQRIDFSIHSTLIFSYRGEIEIWHTTKSARQTKASERKKKNAMWCVALSRGFRGRSYHPQEGRQRGKWKHGNETETHKIYIIFFSYFEKVYL
jgi:hypothetical protein